MDRHYLMVRAMTSQDIHFKEFFDNDVVAVGWSDIDFSKYADDQSLREAIREQYYSGKSSAHVSMNLNECIRFKNITAGDYIIIPYYSGIALAVAESEEMYSAKAVDIDLANQHRVVYKYKNDEILSMPRSNLSEGLQRRLRVPCRSVTDLYDFADEIDKLFANPESYFYPNEVKKQEDMLEREFKQKLLQNIQAGKTNLQTGGIGMEQLVKELFECEGYEAKVLAKSASPGDSDADIKAWRYDSFKTIVIYVQVKHHSGYSGQKGIEQIIGAVASKEPGSEGYFITSASVSEDDRKYAQDNNIRVIDGEELVDIIFDNRNKLSKDTMKRLGIVMVPTIF